MNRLKVFLADANKKNIFKILKEIIILTIKKKEIPFYYFKYAYRKTVPNYLDHLGLKEQIKLQTHRSLHNPEYVKILDHKLFFALFSYKCGIKTPDLISYNIKTKFFYKNQLIQISNEQELLNVFTEMFKEIDGLFFRPFSGNSGKGCFKITKSDFKTQIKVYADTLLNNNYVFNEVVKQHHLINEIHAQSLNTLRILTLITSEGKIEIISAFMRFGVGDSVVDNSHSGGFFVSINLDEGTLKPNGHYMPEFGSKEIIEHPDTGYNFGGFKIPYYDEAFKSVIDAVKIIPDRLIGWDVAISENGPLIIEANSKPNIQGLNIAYGGLLKNKHIKKVIAELS